MSPKDYDFVDKILQVHRYEMKVVLIDFNYSLRHFTCMDGGTRVVQIKIVLRYSFCVANLVF